ncbi:MAG: biopolymer transporter ExbD [Treponema sp.]|jgi:biopolymer transport protein ExbD|nr:biopolymer transporter ExbD [Treponema sp.]
MRLARKRRGGFGETSASSDIAFLLIIYFLVIAGFNVNKGFLMTLPAKDSSRLILKEDLLRFELDDDGSLLFQGAVISSGEVERTIRSATAANPNLAVILTVSPLAHWQQVVSFVEMAQKLSVDSFSFTMAEARGGP